MRFMGVTCLSEELCCLKIKKSAWESSESSRFAYSVYRAVQLLEEVRVVVQEYN